MPNLWTIAMWVKTPLIKEWDNLVQIVVDSLLEASKKNNFSIQNNDVLAITEAVVSICQGNYATIDDIAQDILNKFKSEHIWILFPILSRNRFAGILKAVARACKKITIQLSYPFDEVGNGILYEEDLKRLKVNPYSDLIDEKKYQTNFSWYRHPFTGLNMVDYYRNLCQNENCEIEIILSNTPEDILKYTKNILVSNVHNREKIKKILLNQEHEKILWLDEILNQKTDKHWYNETFWLLWTNLATDQRLKLFPHFNDPVVNQIKNEIKKLTNKDIHVMIYGDGAFKDPVGWIWELADPVISPSYTEGLKGSPNEIKLKYLIDKNSNKSKEDLQKIIQKEISLKTNSQTEQNKLGTTPRRYIDLLGSLSDLVSGSGEKGTPVVYIQNYFKWYSS